MEKRERPAIAGKAREQVEIGIGACRVRHPACEAVRPACGTAILEVGAVREHERIAAQGEAVERFRVARMAGEVAGQRLEGLVCLEGVARPEQIRGMTRCRHDQATAPHAERTARSSATRAANAIRVGNSHGVVLKASWPVRRADSTRVLLRAGCPRWEGPGRSRGAWTADGSTRSWKVSRILSSRITDGCRP